MARWCVCGAAAAVHALSFDGSAFSKAALGSTGTVPASGTYNPHLLSCFAAVVNDMLQLSPPRAAVPSSPSQLKQGSHITNGSWSSAAAGP
jgi:hypothetical protein